MPWVPRDLYELLLDALRDTRASVASPVVPESVAVDPVDVPEANFGNPPVTEPAVLLPRMVTDAIAMYAFGDPLEAAANYQRAVALHEAGKRPADIVREIRQGANPEAFI